MALSSPMVLFLSVLLTVISVIPTCYANSSAAQWKPFSRVGKSVTRSRTFSEEGSGTSGRQTAPIAGIRCSGRYCDDKKLVIVRDGTAAPVLNSRHWTGFFSEENPSGANCPPNMIVNEMQCNKRYCDRIRLQCGRLASDYRVDTSDIKTVNWFSEEEGERLCPDGYYFWGMKCRGRYCDELRLNCARVDYKKPKSPFNVVSNSRKYAPIYFFDGKGPEHCLPDWPSLSNNNHCRTSFLPSTPVFVSYNICGAFEVYTFWVWYGDQKPCTPADKGHGNDWEKISVFVSDGLVQKVTFYQHRGRYTRRRGTFGMTGERPHVYVGKISHGSYHTHCDGKCSAKDFFNHFCTGSVNYCQGGCGYWEDFRNPGPKLEKFTIHEFHPGDTIDGIRRPDSELCVSSCAGSKYRLVGTSGCWQNNV